MTPVTAGDAVVGAAGLAGGLASAWLIGWATLPRSLRGHPQAAGLMFAWGLLGMSGILLLLYGLALPPSRGLLAAGCLGAAAVRLLRSRSGDASGLAGDASPYPTPPRDDTPARWHRAGLRLLASRRAWFGLLAVALVAVLAVNLARATAHGWFAYPALQTWGLKTRVMLETGRIPMALFHDPGWGYSHPSYPLAFPLSLVWMFRWRGEFDTRFISIAPWSMLAVSAGWVWTRLRGVPGTGARMMAVALVAWMASVLPRALAWSGHAEPLLILVLLAGSVLVLDGHRAGNRAWTLWGWILLGAAGWVKNEGAVLFAGAAAGWALVNLRRPHRGLWCLVGLLPLLPWRVWSAWQGLPEPDFAWVRPGPAEWGYAWQALRTVWEQAMTSAGPAPLWAALAGAWLLFPRRAWRTPDLRFATAMLGVVTVATAGAYMFSTWMARDPAVHLAAVPRLLAVPLILLPEAVARVHATPARPTPCLASRT